MTQITGERRLEGPACGNCQQTEARCAWTGGCCDHCQHRFTARKREALAERPVQVAPDSPVVIVPIRVGVAPHELNLTDPLDKLYLELLPTRPTPTHQVSDADLEALVNEVCPHTGFRALRDEAVA